MVPWEGLFPLWWCPQPPREGDLETFARHSCSECPAFTSGFQIAVILGCDDWSAGSPALLMAAHHPLTRAPTL